MTQIHNGIRVVVRVLCVAGLLALGYVTYGVIDAQIYQPLEHRQLERASPNAAARAGNRGDPGVERARGRRVRPDLDRGAESRRIMEG